MLKIYFVYNFKNHINAEKRIKDLRSLENVDLFVFQYDEKKPNRSWKAHARKKIKECDFVCCYLDEEKFGASSKSIAWECRAARHFKKKIFFVDAVRDAEYLKREAEKKDGRPWEEQQPASDKKREWTPDHPFSKLFEVCFNESNLNVNLNDFNKTKKTLADKGTWSADDVVVQDSFFNDRIAGSDFNNILLEQYKLMVQTSESLIDRRQTTSNVYIGIITALISLVGSSFALSNRIATGIIFIAVGFLITVLTVNWRAMLNNYQKNNEGKFAVINAIEKKLPANMFDTEYCYNKLHQIRSYGERELSMCTLFFVVGCILAAGGVAVLIVKAIGIF